MQELSGPHLSYETGPERLPIQYNNLLKGLQVTPLCDVGFVVAANYAAQNTGTDVSTVFGCLHPVGQSIIGCRKDLESINGPSRATGYVVVRPVGILDRQSCRLLLPAVNTICCLRKVSL